MPRAEKPSSRPAKPAASSKAPKKAPRKPQAKPKQAPKPRGQGKAPAAPQKAPRKPGRPPGSGLFKPTQEQRELVEMLAGCGIPQHDICKLVRSERTGEGISINTLRKYFMDQIERGEVQANVKVIGALFKNAVNNQNVTAQIYWTKVRSGWREKVTVEAPAGGESATDNPDTLEVARRIAFTMALGAHQVKKEQ